MSLPVLGSLGPAVIIFARRALAPALPTDVPTPTIPWEAEKAMWRALSEPVQLLPIVPSFNPSLDVDPIARPESNSIKDETLTNMPLPLDSSGPGLPMNPVTVVVQSLSAEILKFVKGKLPSSLAMRPVTALPNFAKPSVPQKTSTMQTSSTGSTLLFTPGTKIGRDFPHIDPEVEDIERTLERQMLFEDIGHFRDTIYRYFGSTNLPPYFSSYFRSPEYAPLEVSLANYNDT